MVITRFFRSFSSMAPRRPIKLTWIDMEMTGLDLDKDEIMEVACIVTDNELKAVHEGFETVIHVNDDKLDNMNEWCTENHRKTGLTDACRKSQVSLKCAERQLCAYIKQHSAPNDLLYMSGNTIYMDRMFLNKNMPEVNKILHYRMVDVSSVKILHESWFPNARPVRKNNAHRALDDIQNSIKELQFYRESIFKNLQST